VRTETIPLEETDCFSPFFIDYINQKEELKPFYTAFPTVKNFQDSISKRNFPDANRSVLHAVLTEQYQDLSKTEAVNKNIDALKEAKTFTVTTGHQLNIFTGPLYFIYKIVTVINACKTLKQAYPEYTFVPVYWMASEDHDYEEINHFHFEGKKLEWKTEQTGAVGHFDPNGLLKLAKQLPQGANFFEKAYSEKTLANAVRSYVNHLFGSEGIVVVDADHPELKKQFVHVMEEDLFQNGPEQLVLKSTSALTDLGYKTQVNPRPINFFYMDEGLRERIEKTDQGFEVLNTDLVFDADQLRGLIKNQPEKLSPNVILRPLYQETILPNLAYVGGPSEAIYWLQLKEVFDHFETAFPLLMPRNCSLIIPESASKKWLKTGLAQKDIFLSSESAFEKWVKANSKNELSFKGEIKEYQSLGEDLKTKASQVDQTLLQHLDAIHQSFKNKLEKAEKKLLRAEKRLHSDRLNQIQAVKEALFPSGSLQERRENFLNFYLKDEQFIRHLLDTFDAFNYKMYLLYE